MRLGYISRIVRYPFKSMAAEPLESAYLMYSGVQGDRLFALVSPTARPTFPWLSIREFPELARYRPRFRHLPDQHVPYPTLKDYELEVQTPLGDCYHTSDADFESNLRKSVGRALEVRFSERSMVDARPLSLLGEQTIRQLEDELDRPVGWARFRANLYVEWDDLAGFGEASLVGRVVSVGEKAEIQISKTDPRCAVVTVDPDTGARDANLLRHIVRQHDNIAGVYAVVLREGEVRVGDVLRCLR